MTLPLPLRTRHGRTFVWLMAALTCLSMGCGSGRMRLYPVTGRVLYQGQPAAGVKVVLRPAENTPEWVGIFPHGKTEDDGTFTLSTFEGGDGAPAGDYLVAIEWPIEVRSPEDPEARGQKEDHFQGRYADFDSSGLRLTIQPGARTLETLHLD